MTCRGFPRLLGAGAVALVAAAVAARAAPAPTVEPVDGGHAFAYRVRAGDTPASIARAFGLDEAALAALLDRHDATDWRRVREGATWRIPNPLSERVAAAEARAADAEARHEAARTRLESLERALADARAAVAADAHRHAWLERVAFRARAAGAAALVLAVALLAALAGLLHERARGRRAQRWARALAAEGEERRRAALAERQEAARRLVVLEDRLRHLELAAVASSAAAGTARVRLVERPG